MNGRPLPTSTAFPTRRSWLHETWARFASSPDQHGAPGAPPAGGAVALLAADGWLVVFASKSPDVAVEHAERWAARGYPVAVRSTVVADPDGCSPRPTCSTVCARGTPRCPISHPAR